MFLPLDPQLIREFDRRMREIQKPEWDEIRGLRIRESLLAAGSSCGSGLSVGFGALFEIHQSGYCFGDRVRIGGYSYLGPKNRLLRYSVILEDDVTLEAFVSMTANQHLYGDDTRNYKSGNQGKLIHVKREARIEARSTIVSGCTVGVGATVRAGSVVIRDVPDYAVVEGIPAEIVK
jgi:UDP-2-acetamido-3-amino-2,3-dideoxy-glucuronate N-acetyltransferase